MGAAFSTFEAEITSCKKGEKGMKKYGLILILLSLASNADRITVHNRTTRDVYVAIYFTGHQIVLGK